jgi:hypothetical protein
MGGDIPTRSFSSRGEFVREFCKCTRGAKAAESNQERCRLTCDALHILRAGTQSPVLRTETKFIEDIRQAWHRALDRLVDPLESYGVDPQMFIDDYVHVYGEYP